MAELTLVIGANGAGRSTWLVCTECGAGYEEEAGRLLPKP